MSEDGQPVEPQDNLGPARAGQPAAPTATPAVPSTDPKTIASLIHASAIFLGFIGPLVGYLVYANDPFIREHSRQALNFQITLLIGLLVSFVLIIVHIGFVTMFALIIIASLVLHIQAAVAASKGNMFQYPATIQFIK